MQSNINTVDLCGKHPEEILLENLKTTGFVILKNHDVPVHLLKDILNQWKKFFSSKEKYNYLRTDTTDEGFIPINGETAKKGEVADFKELYQTHYRGAYPTNIDISSTSQLFTELVKLGEKITHLIEEALPATIKDKMCIPLSEMIEDSYNHLIRIIHYPPVNKGTIIPRATPHTDICLFTMVFGSTSGGLELQDENGSWYEPIIQDNSIVLFNSEMLELSTNGFLKAVVHCVKANPNSYTDSRYSIPVGFHPRRQALLSESLTAAEHLRLRLNEMGYRGDLLNLKDH